MATTALVIFAEGFEDVEAVTAVDVLRRAGIEVTAAGLTPGLLRGARGTAVQPDAALPAAAGTLYDALVLPGGGKGAENLAASPLVKDLVLKHHAAGKVVAAICAAPGVVLAPTGILAGRKATGFPDTEGRFPAGTFRPEAVVADGNLLTGRAMGASLEFALALVEKLAGKGAADKVRAGVSPQ